MPRDHGLQRHRRRRQDHAGHAVGVESGPDGTATRCWSTSICGVRRSTRCSGCRWRRACARCCGSKATVAALVHQIATDNLAVVTAGRWDRQALASLSNGSAAAMFKQLREDLRFRGGRHQPDPARGRCPLRQPARRLGGPLRVPRTSARPRRSRRPARSWRRSACIRVEAVVTGPNDNLYGRHMGTNPRFPPDSEQCR